MTAVQALEKDEVIRIDLGCGINKRTGFIGVDSRNFEGVDIVTDLADKPWPWADESVTEVNASHFIEHLTPSQRIHFCNELYRVLKPAVYDGGKPVVGFATVATPHWASVRAYGDLTHQWPPVSEMWFSYLSKDWRTTQAPHNDAYTCDFVVTWFYTVRQELASRHNEYQVYALNNYKEAAQDIISTWAKK